MSAIRFFAYLFGLIFVFIGVLGFMPDFTKDGLLLGYFSVNPMHNLFHIVTGVVALVLAMDTIYSQWFFRLFGLIYAVIAGIGFWQGSLMMMPLNMADNILHTVIAVVALFFGFVFSTNRR